MKRSVVLFVALVVSVVAVGQVAPTLTVQHSGTKNRLQAVSAVNDQVVWVSGVGGTYGVTTDGGNTWHTAVVPGAETLQFRDVQGVSAKVAYLLAAGSGTDSRIYKTEDGGATWTLQFENQDPNAFYDCFAFWTPMRGLAQSDSSNGRFPTLRTENGHTWIDIGNNLPAPLAGEGSFAASGTCVATQGAENAWVVTTNSRVLATKDGGNSWAAYTAPIAGGTGTAGLFTIDFRDATHGLTGGGDFAGTTILNNVARSEDGGMTWRLTRPAPITGAIFGLSYVEHGTMPNGFQRTAVATGPGGAAWTPDEGGSWYPLHVKNYWAVTFASPEAGWLVGTEGRILKVSF
ncbi:MAG: hypothetical protein JOZ43_04075 [Acidobacteriales bacterium]|nr:hypothetical protein [Terriglobales bacterium]